VVALWIGMVALFGTAAATLAGPTSEAFTIPGTESQRAIELVQDRFPQTAVGGATARVVVAAPDGGAVLDPAYEDTIAQLVGALETAPQVARVVGPAESGAVSADGRIAYAEVSYSVGAGELTDEARDALDEAVEGARASGLTVEVGGDATAEEFEQGTAELIGLGVAAIVLMITFGSLVAAGLPLLNALVAIAVGVTAVTASTRFFELSSSTTILAVMLGLAVAIDYSLFIVSRYRSELAAGRDPDDAIGRALGTAGSAVVFAGLTVVIALAGLSVVGIPFLATMGLAAAFTVAIAVLVALTLLPASLGFAGRRVLSRSMRRAQWGGGDAGAPTVGFSDPPASVQATARRSAGLRWVSGLTRRPTAVVVGAVLGLGVLALPALDLRLGLPDDSQAAPGSTIREAHELLAEGFGPGFSGPLIVVVDGAQTADPQGAVAEVETALGDLAGVAAVTPSVFDPAGSTALLTVVPASGPNTQATSDLVTMIRGIGSSLSDDFGATVAVTGQTAMSIDVSTTLRNALLPYLLLVVGLAIILLTLVFRSVVVPLVATLGFLLTIAATFGAVVAIFQWGWLADLLGVQGQTGPIISVLPVFMIGVVFGLAMDYQVFLVTRMREEHVNGRSPKDSVITGFRHGARVVTAAAVIMTSVFASFMLTPDALVRQIGFGLAVGVLVDALVVRMTIMPAVMSLLGTSAWWLPRWLDRLVPEIDVEGSRLHPQPAGPAPEPTPVGSAVAVGGGVRAE
jgi:RND superfamily putative drug exporter